MVKTIPATAEGVSGTAYLGAAADSPTFSQVKAAARREARWVQDLFAEALASAPTAFRRDQEWAEAKAAARLGRHGTGPSLVRLTRAWADGWSWARKEGAWQRLLTMADQFGQSLDEALGSVKMGHYAHLEHLLLRRDDLEALLELTQWDDPPRLNEIVRTLRVADVKGVEAMKSLPFWGFDAEWASDAAIITAQGEWWVAPLLTPEERAEDEPDFQRYTHLRGR